MAFDLKEYQRRYYQEHKEDYARRDKHWSGQNRAKRVQYTLKSRAKNQDRYKRYQKEYGSHYHQTHKQELNEYNRKYSPAHYQANKFYYWLKSAQRRAKLKMSDANLATLRQFCKSVRGKRAVVCYYCQQIISGQKAHFDHIIPLAKGGQHAVENLCVCCPECNRSKGAKAVQTWIKNGQQLLEL